MTVSPPSVSFGPSFFSSIDGLSPNDYMRVMKAVQKFTRDPDHPSLNLHPVKYDNSNRLYTMRGSDELRILAIRLGEGVWVIEEAGRHDAIYLRAETGKFVASHDGSNIGFYVPGDEVKPQISSTSNDKIINANDSPGVLDHWSNTELSEVGFSDIEILEFRKCADVPSLLDLDIEYEKLCLAIDILEQTPEIWNKRSQGLFEIDSETPQLVELVEKHGSSWGFSTFMSPEELDRLLSAPIEKWMIFLHPQQQAIVDRVYEGPARIGGSAGTGKTVVGLHRAAALANKFVKEDVNSKILFTTYINSLPPYFEKLYEQIPNSIPSAVVFAHVQKLARDVCEAAGLRIRVNKVKADAAFDEAISKVVREGSAIDKSKISNDYVKEEIDHVIRGQMIASIEEYLDLERRGRKTPLQVNVRKQIWKLHLTYKEIKNRDGVFDYVDEVDAALKISANCSSQYRAAIIDEAQDLSLIGLQLIRNLVNGKDGKDKQDGLLFIGDGAQRIYASCITLSQAGIQVRGRSTILEKNYRNTAEILKAAGAVVGDRQVDDLGEMISTISKSSSELPTGPLPRLIIVESLETSTQYIVNRIEELVTSRNIGYGDIAVLAPTNRIVGGITYGLSQNDIPAAQLTTGQTSPVGCVRVATFHRVKGLEFKAVIMTNMQNFPSKVKRGDAATTFADRFELELNVTFVAMTRAREVLDLISLGSPSDPILNAADFFEVIKL